MFWKNSEIWLDTKIKFEKLIGVRSPSKLIIISGRMADEDNSYEEYKKYLEESLGISSIKPPQKPMNAYMRFFLERGCQERQKGSV